MVPSLTKREAITRINRLYGEKRLNHSNTRFANINTAKDVWWLEIPLGKVRVGGLSEINLLLCGDRDDELHYLQVPTEFLRTNHEAFIVRDDKDVIALELSADQKRLFEDVRSKSGNVRFLRFKQALPTVHRAQE